MLTSTGMQEPFQKGTILVVLDAFSSTLHTVDYFLL